MFFTRLSKRKNSHREKCTIVMGLCLFFLSAYMYKKNRASLALKDDSRKNCKLVLSSYILLPQDQKRLAKQPNSMMNLTCTYVLSILNTFGENAELRLIGWKSSLRFEGFVSKIRAARLLASSLSPDTILMMTDAFDVIVQKPIGCTHLREILDTKYDGKMIFVGEKQCYPLSRKKYFQGIQTKEKSGKKL